MNKKIIFRKFRTFVKKPKVLFIKLLQLVSPILPDRIYLKMLFPLYTGYKLDLKNPRTYNQKLQWLKLYYRKPIMTKMVDKYEAKEYISQILGEEYVVKNYGVWNSFDEIDFDALPNQFVLKTTHDQGGVVICKDKHNFDYRQAKKKLNKHLKVKHFYLTREWPYKNVKPRILAEEYLNPNEDASFKDYKFYCFNGVPKVMYVSMGKHSGKMTFDYFDMEFNLLNIERPNIQNSGKQTTKPEQFDLMKELAAKLSVGFPHLRTDFYEVKGRIYVGELTFFQGGGLMPFIPQKWDYTLGDWIDLSKSKLK